MNPIIHNFRYRPEIDGLRAIAVLAVVMFHAGFGFSGGYVGVDVFFVISGFLITSIIIKDLQDGTFSFANFWERRARRILPAGTAMVLSTLIAGWFLLLPSDYAKLGASAAWHGGFAGNIYFWKSTDYFAGPSEEVPLLHMWSLAVEEQFYFLLPFLMVAVTHLGFLRTRSSLIWFLAAALVGSFLLSVYCVPRMPVAAFYLLPTRAWELLIGSIVAVLPILPTAKYQRLREVLAFSGLAAIFVPYFTYSSTTEFPGLAAAPPCLGAALFIWSSGTSNASSVLPIAARILATPPLVFIGLISYSLYLWHWPLLAIANYWDFEHSVATRLILVVAGLLLAIVSWKYIETPFRVRKLSTTRVAMFRFAAGATVAVIGVGLLITASSGLRERFPEKAVAIAATADEPHSPEASFFDVTHGKLVRVGPPDSNAPARILLWGDSHARMLIPALTSLCEEYGVAAEVATRSSTAPVIDFPQYKSRWTPNSDRTEEWNRAVFQYILQQRVPNVILAARWSSHLRDGHIASSGTFEGQHLSIALAAMIDQLIEAGTQVWICDEVPDHLNAVPKALALHLTAPSVYPLHLASEDHYKSQVESFQGLAEILASRNVRYLELANCFRDDAYGTYKSGNEFECYYYDSHHLSRAGAKVTQPAFVPVFESLDSLHQ